MKYAEFLIIKVLDNMFYCNDITPYHSCSLLVHIGMQMAVHRRRRKRQLKVDGPVREDEADVDPSFTVR